jgi:hypothetical protein
LLEPLDPSKNAAKFLQRVSRCYVYGFDTECVVMCRSVLDAEFESEISADDCISALGGNFRNRYNLDDRISAAGKLNRVSFEACEHAHDVRRTGNNAVHVRADAKVDPLSVIKKTLSVIRELHQEA